MSQSFDDTIIEKYFQVSSSYKGIILGLVMIATGLGTVNLVEPNKDHVVNRVRNIEYFVNDFENKKLNYKTENIYEYAESLRVRKLLISQSGFNSRMAAADEKDLISSVASTIAVIPIILGLSSVSTYFIYNAMLKKYNTNKKNILK